MRAARSGEVFEQERDVREDREGGPIEFLTTCRIDTPVEIDYYRNGGILQTVLRRLMKS